VQTDLTDSCAFGSTFLCPQVGDSATVGRIASFEGI
jgi:hypothetical protein